MCNLYHLLGKMFHGFQSWRHLVSHSWGCLQIQKWTGMVSFFLFICTFCCDVCKGRVSKWNDFLSHYETCLFNVSIQWNIFIWKDFRWLRRLREINHLWLKYQANKEVKDRVTDFLRGMKSNNFSKSSQIIAELSSFKYSYKPVAVQTFPCLLWFTHLQWVDHLCSDSAYVNNCPPIWALE